MGESNIFGCLVQAGPRTFPFQSWLHHDQNSRMSVTKLCPLRLLSHLSSGIWLRYRSKLNRIAVQARSFWARIIWCEVGLCLRTFWWMVPSKLPYLSHFSVLSPCLRHVFASSPHITCNTGIYIYTTKYNIYIHIYIFIYYWHQTNTVRILGVHLCLKNILSTWFFMSKY